MYYLAFVNFLNLRLLLDLCLLLLWLCLLLRFLLFLVFLVTSSLPDWVIREGILIHLNDTLKVFHLTLNRISAIDHLYLFLIGCDFASLNFLFGILDLV